MVSLCNTVKSGRQTVTIYDPPFGILNIQNKNFEKKNHEPYKNIVCQPMKIPPK